jgi:dTDP-6-deoxy-L-talose 4-dehydrogenase (NAD+)
VKILVTGVTGFVGSHVVSRLLASGHTVVAVARDEVRARTLPWFEQVEFVAHDLHNAAWNWQKSAIPDVLIHLAWPGLPNYQDFLHIGKNLPADLQFLESAVQGGVPHLIVAGTCLEYGMQYGPLGEEMETRPFTPYGFAKDALRKSLEILQRRHPFTLQWVRLFYMYGEGQNPYSLLSQLDRALDEGRDRFEMSAGDQLRDYLPIETIARCFDWASTHPEMSGVINCCSGKPISVLDLVNQHLAKRNGKIHLVRGHYPYPDYEPMAFWGVPEKLTKTGFIFG